RRMSPRLRTRNPARMPSLPETVAVVLLLFGHRRRPAPRCGRPRRRGGYRRRRGLGERAPHLRKGVLQQAVRRGGVSGLIEHPRELPVVAVRTDPRRTEPAAPGQTGPAGRETDRGTVRAAAVGAAEDDRRRLGRDRDDAASITVGTSA